MEENDINYSEKKVRQLNKYEDILDVFINIVLLRLPTVYVLINMILMIWLVQTIYSSLNNDSVPKSLYLLVPFLSTRPVTALYFSFESKCNAGFQQVILKTVPSITDLSLKKSKLTRWRQQSLICIKKSQKPGNFSIKCQQNTTYCSGICVKNKQQCPITSIRKINTNENIMINDVVLYYTPDSLYKYVASRNNKTNFIVGFLAQFESRCANQYYFYDIFSTFQEYWQVTKTCGKQGFLPAEVYLPFDRIKATQFFENNAILNDKISQVTQNQGADLGYVKNVKYSQTIQCSRASQIAQQLQIKLSQGPITSLYSKNILIIAFVLFTLCWIWLVVAYCFEGPLAIKNIFIIVLASIQFIALCFVYNQNLKIVEIQNMITVISNCIDDPTPAFKNWQFGVEDKSPFLFIIFASAAFLLLQILSFFISCCIYVPYYVQSRQMDRQASYMWIRDSQR